MQSNLARVRKELDFSHIPTHLSNSSLKKFLDCELSWAGQYLAKQRDGSGSIALERGDMLHTCLELYNNIYKEKGELPELCTILEAWDALCEIERVADWGEIQQRGNECLRIYHANVAPWLKPHLIEWPFVVPIYGSKYIKTFIGRVDVVMPTMNVVDYKGSARKMSQADVDIDLQPFSYLAALNHYYGTRNIEFSFCQFMFKGKEPRVEVVKTKRSYDELLWFYKKVITPTLLRMDEIIDAYIDTGKIVAVANPSGKHNWCPIAEWCGWEL